MKTKLLIGFLSICVSQAFAQGNWNTTVNNWSYNMTGDLPPAYVDDTPLGHSYTIEKNTEDVITKVTLTKAEVSGTTSLSSNGNSTADATYLPKPEDSGIAILRLRANVAQTAFFDRPSKLFSLPLTGAGTVIKYSLYGMTQATNIGKFAFKMKFDVPNRTDGTLRVFIAGGDGTAAFLNDANNTSTAAIAGVYGSLGFAFGADNDIAFTYRKRTGATNSAVYTALTGVSIVRGGTYDFEMYCNNTETPQYYTKNEIVETLPARAMHVWVDGVKVEGDAGPDLISNSATSGVEYVVDKKLHGIMFHGNGGSTGTLADHMEISNASAQFATEQTLSVALSSFTAKKVNDAVNINWSTASETNNSYFEVLRSVDGKVFEVLGSVTGAGNSDEVHHYSFRDNTPAQGVNYYKLKQVDIDGKFSESNVVSVKTDFREDGFQIVKDGSSDLYALIQSQEATSGVIRVTDMIGKVLSQENIKLENGSTKIQLASISIPGVYVATLTTSAGKAYSVKFVK